MNHLAATRRGSSPGLPMQMSTHLLEPAPIMSREIETKTVHCTLGTHIHEHVSKGYCHRSARERKQHVRKMCTYICVHY